jgi:hypothetical protein
MVDDWYDAGLVLMVQEKPDLVREAIDPVGVMPAKPL